VAYLQSEPPEDAERKADIRVGLLRDTILTASPNRWKRRPSADELTPKWEYGQPGSKPDRPLSPMHALAAAMRKTDKVQ
jgi:hypothetical protein